MNAYIMENNIISSLNMYVPFVKNIKVDFYSPQELTKKRRNLFVFNCMTHSHNFLYSFWDKGRREGRVAMCVTLE